MVLNSIKETFLQQPQNLILKQYEELFHVCEYDLLFHFSDIFGIVNNALDD